MSVESYMCDFKVKNFEIKPIFAKKNIKTDGGFSYTPTHGIRVLK